MNIDQAGLMGYFLKRNDIENCKLEVFFKELQIYIFELKIIKKSIFSFLTQDFSALDSAVGDWKCQTRASMIIDLIINNPYLSEQLSKEICILDALLEQHVSFFQKTLHGSYFEKRAIEQELHHTSLQTYLKKNNLNYEPSQDLLFLSLCFFLTPKNIESSFVAEHQISKNKLKSLFNIAKRHLCHMSIHYEKGLAQQYGTIEEQKSLTQIEHKEIQCMTSLYCGFNVIYKKMKQLQQSFLTKTVLFCHCGGIKKTEVKKFSVINNCFIESSFNENSQEPIMVLEGYNYEGTLASLKNTLQVPEEDIYVYEQYYKSCNCTHVPEKFLINNIDETIMAFFAQHPQFTNGVNIDFEQLNLIDSDLRQKYIYLKTLPGVSMNDMSNFFIDHVYCSTIQNVYKSLQNF